MDIIVVHVRIAFKQGVGDTHTSCWSNLFPNIHKQVVLFQIKRRLDERPNTHKIT